MPLTPEHIKRFIEDKTYTKFSSEMLNLLVKTIDNLCFKECQIDRIQCTLTPLCTRRQFLKLRMKNGLSIEDLPKFCYSVQKNIVFRDFRNKTVVYKPFDAYLYLLDFCRGRIAASLFALVGTIERVPSPRFASPGFGFSGKGLLCLGQ